MKRITLNEMPFDIDERLENFEIVKKPSSYIFAIGINMVSGELFVQFMDGYAVIYSGLGLQDFVSARNAESIGKFVIALKKSYTGRHIGHHLLKPAELEIVLLKADIQGHKGTVYGKKHEECEIVSYGSNTYILKNKKGDKFPVNHDEVLKKSPNQ